MTTTTAAPIYNCDGRNYFFCPTASGTCYAGPDGYIGCCSASSCAPRPACFDYTRTGMPSCDLNTGGCRACTDPALPYCFCITNTQAQQYILYCNSVGGWATTGYPNNVALSTAYPLDYLQTPLTSHHSTTTEASTTIPTTSSTPSAAASPSISAPNPTNISNPSTTRPPVNPPIGAIAGGVVGSVAGLAALIVLLLTLHRKRRLSHDRMRNTYRPAHFAEDKSDEDLRYDHQAAISEDKGMIGLGIHQAGPVEVPGSEGVVPPLPPMKTVDAPDDFYNLQRRHQQHQRQQQHFTQQQDSAAHHISEAPSPLQPLSSPNNSPDSNSNSVSNFGSSFYNPSPNLNMYMCANTNMYTNPDQHPSTASTIHPPPPPPSPLNVNHRPSSSSVSQAQFPAGGGAVGTTTRDFTPAPSPLVPRAHMQIPELAGETNMPAVHNMPEHNTTATSQPEPQPTDIAQPQPQSQIIIPNKTIRREESIYGENDTGGGLSSAATLRPTATATSLLTPPPPPLPPSPSPWAEVGFAYQSAENAMQFGFRDSFLGPVAVSAVGSGLAGSGFDGFGSDGDCDPRRGGGGGRDNVLRDDDAGGVLRRDDAAEPQRNDVAGPLGREMVWGQGRAGRSDK